MRGKAKLIIDENGGISALVGGADFQRLNAGGDFWGALSSEVRSGALEVYPPTLDRQRLTAVTQEAEEALLAAGCETFEMPVSVAKSVEDKARELRLSADSLMDIIIRNREAEDTLCIRDIMRGFDIASRRERRRRRR